MRTSRYTYNKKVGLNIANQFFKSIDDKKAKYLDIFFRENEREAIGRRILISIYILEGYDYLSIINKTKCGRQTYSTVKKQLLEYRDDYKKLLRDLRNVYFSQFPKRQQGSMYSHSFSGAQKFFSLTTNELDKKVQL